MTKRQNRDYAFLKSVYDRIYAPKTVMAASPRKPVYDVVAEAEEFRVGILEFSERLNKNPRDREALIGLKKLFCSYKAFYTRRRNKMKNGRKSPGRLLEIFAEISFSEITELMIKCDLEQYNSYFESRPSVMRPRVSTVINKARGVRKRMREETVFDIYRTLYAFENIKLKIEEGMLENPKEFYPAARAVKRRFVIHTGTTNTGKTYNAIKALKAAETGAYLGPLRLLALEVQEELLVSDVMCNLKTGEEENIVKYATHVSSTVEMADVYAMYDTVVIDECQMIGDKFRGCAWTRAILGMRAHEIHLCTAPDAVDILVRIIVDCGDEYEIIRYERRTPLIYDNSLETDADISWVNDRGDLRKPPVEARLGKIRLDRLCRGDALIAFSRTDVLDISDALKSRGIKASVIYGALPYGARKQQLKRFLDGETTVVVATDAIGMGLNLPIRRVIFTTPYKYDGKNYRPLNPSEIKQIAGRAGRIGIYDQGYVYSVAEHEHIEASLTSEYSRIEQAYLEFDTAFVEFDYNLADILKAWKEAEMPFDMYRKINVDRTLRLLGIIDRLCSEKKLECDKETAYSLANVIFDETEKHLVREWMEYVRAHLGRGIIKTPGIRKGSLQNLEISFKKIELYYSFCKTMGYEPDMEWIDNMKLYISDEIDYVLKNKGDVKNV